VSVQILFLGPLQDISGCIEQEAPAPLDWPRLLDAVGPSVAEQLEADERIQVACSGVVLADRTKLRARDGDKVGLLPPVSGG